MGKLKTMAHRRNLIFLKLHRELVVTNIAVQTSKGPSLSELRLMEVLTRADQTGNWEMLRPQSNLVERFLVVRVQESCL